MYMFGYLLLIATLFWLLSKHFSTDRELIKFHERSYNNAIRRFRQKVAVAKSMNEWKNGDKKRDRHEDFNHWAD